MKKILSITILFALSSCAKEYNCECVANKYYGVGNEVFISEDYSAKKKSYTEAKDWCDNQTNLYRYDFVEEGDDLLGYDVQCALK